MSSEDVHGKRSLEQVLALFVGALLLILLIGSFVINIHNMRSYLQQQLQTHAQDAATSLGLSLSTVVDARNSVLAERMIAAIFDSGDYQRIVYRDIAGDVIRRFEAEAPLESVPQWFSDAIPLQAPVAESQVMAGWTQLGTLEVQSHAGYAYLELWHLARNQLGLYLLAALAAFALMHAMLRFVLRPLQRMEEQAHAIAERRFDERAQIPKTRELARVAIAMNAMASTLGRLFDDQVKLIEGLREKSIIDKLTGLHNREGFDNRLRAELDSEERMAQGSLLLLQLHDFGAVNHQLGRESADDLLRAVGEQFHTLSKKHAGAFAARRSGADFSLLLPGITGEALEEVAAALLAQVAGLQQVKQVLRDDLVFIGAVVVQADDDAGSLLSKADMALTQAVGRGRSGWLRYIETGAEELIEEVRQAGEWQALLLQTLADESIELHLQPVFGVADQELLYQQVLARMELDGKLVAAGVFLPMAERFHLMSKFDQLIVKRALALLPELDDSTRLGISLSEHSVASDEFLAWLDKTLGKAPRLAGRLIFEVPEHVVNLYEMGLSELSDLTRRHGSQVFIERFGVASVPFSYLQRVHLNAIKIDASFIRDIHYSPDKQFFVRSAAQIAHSRGIKLIAVGVESEQELAMLGSLGIDGAMGYHLGRPQSATA